MIAQNIVLRSSVFLRKESNMKIKLITAAALLLLFSPLCVSAETTDSSCYKTLSEICLQEEDATESIIFTLGSNEYTTDQGRSGTCAASVFESNGKIYIPADTIENELDVEFQDFSDTDSIFLFSENEQKDRITVENGTVMIDIEAAAPILGLELERNDDKLTVTDPYASRRIVVTGNTNFETPSGCESLTLPYGTRIISCDTRESAHEICEYLNNKVGTNAAPDVTFTIYESKNDGGYLWNDHLSWGTDYIKSDIFNSRLLQKYGTINDLESISIAVIDSGVDYTHPFLSERIDLDKGYDFYNGDTDPMDNKGHGTHVAGIICDNTLANVTIIPYRITDDNGNATLSQLTAALERAIIDKADIINLSLGSKDLNGAVRKVLTPLFNEMTELGITAVAGAGNSQADASLYTPANITSCITVNACDQNGKFASSYSNYGDVIDVCAPGTQINSTIPQNQYGIKSGTSMACPHVSAAAAMLKSYNSSLTPYEIETAITECADDAGTDGFDILYGWGILNAEALADLYIPEYQTCLFDGPDISDDSVSVRFIKPYIPSDGAVIAAAAYSNGTLMSFGTCNVSPGKNIADHEFTIPLNIKECDTLKLFMFKDLSSIDPLSDSYTIAITE